MFRGQVYQQKFGTAMGSPVSPIVANLFMEDLEQRAMENAPDDLRPKLWKRYVDDTLEVIRRGKVMEWSEHLNHMDPTGSIKFTHEEETDNSIPILDTHIHRRYDGSIKVKVYIKKTHTNQYLAFDSHHPLHQKMGVIRTLMNRCEELVTEEEDKEEERGTIMKALEACGYPRWTVTNYVKKEMEKKERRRKEIASGEWYEDKRNGGTALCAWSFREVGSDLQEERNRDSHEATFYSEKPSSSP